MMITQDENFAEYFSLAQEEALTARQSRIIDLMYGFATGEHHTLEQIGQEFELSRERIRQILQQSLRKIRSKGKRQIIRGDTDGACAVRATSRFSWTNRCLMRMTVLRLISRALAICLSG
jgi:DNA-binding CsgD family transcriptional regulator